jgi:5-methyltetrahydrofolate--homocysteine methyltransferase
MAIGAGMTSAIMNPVALPVGQKRLEEKRLALAAAGMNVPDGIDPEILAQITGMGSSKAHPGKEMTAIRAANFLTNNDPNGSLWIKHNRPAGDPDKTKTTRSRRRQRNIH